MCSRNAIDRDAVWTSAAGSAWCGTSDPVLPIAAISAPKDVKSAMCCTSVP